MPVPERSWLQLHLPEGWPADGSADALFRYARRGTHGCQTGASRLSDIAPAKTVVVVAPAAAVHFVRVTLPDLRPARLATLLPLAVEEHVAAAPEEIHAVVVNHVPRGESLVMVCDKAWLAAVLDALGAHGLRPASIIAEAELAARLVAQATTPTWIVVRAASGGFARLGADEIIALDLGAHAADVPLALRLARGTHRRSGEAPDEIVVFHAPELGPPDFDFWGRVLHLPVRDGGEWRPELIDARGMHATDLLRGFAVRGGAPLGFSRSVKLAGAAAAAILVLHTVLAFGQGWRLSAERHTLTAQMDRQFREIFPDAKVVVDAPLQMQRGLARLRRAAGMPDAADFVPLLAAVGPALTATGVRTERLRYERGTLEAAVTLPAGTPPTAIEQLVVPGYRMRVERTRDASSADALTLFVQAEG